MMIMVNLKLSGNKSIDFGGLVENKHWLRLKCAELLRASIPKPFMQTPFLTVTSDQ